MSAPQLYLASASPRRAELLTQIGVRYELVTASVDEQRLPGESPRDCVQRLALAKAVTGRQAIKDKQLPVLGADTLVVVDNEVLGKPQDQAAGLAMLQCLSGRLHTVMSAVALVGRDELGHDRQLVCCNESRVWFRAISPQEAERYWQTGEPQDKAGGYAIQGLAAVFIERLEGSYSGVMGLPLFETAELLQAFGIVNKGVS